MICIPPSDGHYSDKDDDQDDDDDDFDAAGHVVCEIMTNVLKLSLIKAINNGALSEKHLRKKVAPLKLVASCG